MLTDRGMNLASEATFYRILKAEDQLHHRGGGKPRGTYSRPTSYTAYAEFKLVAVRSGDAKLPFKPS